jgi:hypothetical protein
MSTQFKRRTVWLLATAALPAALLFGFGAASANAAQQTAPTAHADPSVKSAVWPELHRGDCQQDNGTLVIRSDGTGDWSATTLTYHTHTHDVWHSSFDFYTTAGFHLFHAGTFDSPRMNDGNPPPHYFWTAHFTFDPAEFNSVNIYQTKQHSSC